MEDWVYEVDYTNAETFVFPECDEESRKFVEALRSAPEYQSFAAKLRAKRNSIPMIVSPEGKENFDYLLVKCEELAKAHHSRIEAVIHYKSGDDAKIVLTAAHFMEFDNEDIQLLGELSRRADNVIFENLQDGSIQVRIHVNYFEDGVAEDGTTYDELAARSMEPLFEYFDGIETETPS